VLGDVREALLGDAVDHELLLGRQPGDRAAGVERGANAGLVAEVADLSTMHARVYVSEHDLSKFHIGSEVRLLANGFFKISDASVTAIEPAASEIPPGLIDLSRYKGLRPPNFYVVDVSLSNPSGALKPGMVGTAKVYGQRRSLGGFAWRETRDFFDRRAW